MKKKKKNKERFLLTGTEIPEGCYLQSKIYVPATTIRNLDFPS